MNAQRPPLAVAGVLWLALAAAAAAAQSVAPAGTARAAAPPAETPIAPPAAPVPSPADLEPGVRTSSAASPAPAAVQPSATPRNARPVTRSRNVMDRVELEASQITGNRELPRVLYIVPWKRSDLGDLTGKPVNSLLDEVLAPVDRDVFKRETRYFDALERGAIAPPASAPTAPPTPQASGAAEREPVAPESR